MATAVLEKPRTRTFGRDSAGILMTPREFDRADFENDGIYELINGVLVVSPIPSIREADPNEELGYLLRLYRETHPQGSALDATLPERYVRVGKNRRRPDRSIWAGLGRLPRPFETPSVVAEFVSKGKRDRQRDYVVKRAEYARIKVKEYWVFDRFARTLTVFTRDKGRMKRRVFTENEVYRTPLLPGFELPLARLFALADQWPEREDDDADAWE